MPLQNEINTVTPNVWTSFTTTITGITTNPTLPTAGNFQLSSYYMQVGKLLFVSMNYNQKSNAGAANGSGGYKFNLPTGFVVNPLVQPYTPTPSFFNLSAIGSFIINDASAAGSNPINLRSGSAVLYTYSGSPGVASTYVGTTTFSYFYFVGENTSETSPVGQYNFVSYSALLSVPIL